MTKRQCRYQRGTNGTLHGFAPLCQIQRHRQLDTLVLVQHRFLRHSPLNFQPNHLHLSLRRGLLIIQLSPRQTSLLGHRHCLLRKNRPAHRRNLQPQPHLLHQIYLVSRLHLAQMFHQKLTVQTMKCLAATEECVIQQTLAAKRNVAIQLIVGEFMTMCSLVQQ